MKDKVHAGYELEYLLLEGQCHDKDTMSQPRGLQFTLGRDPQKVDHDTIVMSNFGYFQLKSGPGAWHLKLREGRSRDLYNIKSVDGAEFEDRDIVLTVDSFRSRMIDARVAKKPSMQNEELLVEKPYKKAEKKVCCFL